MHKNRTREKLVTSSFPFGDIKNIGNPYAFSSDKRLKMMKIATFQISPRTVLYVANVLSLRTDNNIK